MPDEILNSELTEALIPPAGANYGAIAAFALTYDGYERFERVAEFANNNTALYHADKATINRRTLTELRACLFFEQRRFRHMDEEPENGDLEYIHALLEAILVRVRENKTE